MSRLALLWACLALIGAFAQPETAIAQERPLAEVLADLNRQGPWRIVYQDAVVEGVRVRWPAEVRDVPNTLRAVVRDAGLAVDLQPELRTLVVFRPVPVRRRISGTVEDARTGERLSYASVRVGAQGVAADATGQFTLVVPAEASRLIVSYVGYEADTLRAPFPEDLRVRLRPAVVERRGAVVMAGSGTFQPLGLGTLFRESRISGGMGLGAANETFGSAGSPPEGLHVVLDGVPVYSPSHMLGAQAAFAPEALRTLAYFDEGAPARFSDPPGGTLALVTRTGSTVRWEGEAGLGPASAYLTLHGPIAQRKISLLASAQFGAPHLGAMSRPLVQTVLAAPQRTSMPDTARFSAQTQDVALFFHDVHVRVGKTWDSGAYAFVSAYTGGDRAESAGFRWIPRSLADPTLERAPAQMRSRWGSETATMQGTVPLAGWLVSGLVAWSHYDARFAQSDFRFDYAPEEAVNPVRRPLDSLFFAQSLWEVRASVSATRSLGNAHSLVAGATFIQYQSRYEEQSGRFLPAFGEVRQSPQTDAFAEHVTSGAWGTLHSGMRVQAFLNGRFVRLAPRIRLESPNELPLKASLSLSRNHQFIHALGFPYTPTPRVWVLSTKGEPPLSAMSVFGTLRYRLHPDVAVQVRGYVREMAHVRIHEAAPGSGLSEPVTLQAPWRTDLDGTVRGLEMLAQGNVARSQGSIRYAWSSVTLREPNGEARPAPWDRRHVLQAETQVALSTNLHLASQWQWATGTPNRLFPQFPDEPSRLPARTRLDAGLSVTHAWALYGMEVHLGVAQLLGRSSVWYRDFVDVLAGSEAQQRLTSEPALIYDAGMRPFFRLRVFTREAY